jgi:hypothetical protein
MGITLEIIILEFGGIETIKNCGNPVKPRVKSLTKVEV